MSRKHKHAEHDAHPDERWLLTYADMITLLMALFIVMFSISNVNKGKFNELSKSLNTAFNGPPVIQGGEAIKQTGGEPGIPTPAAAPPKPSLQAAFAPRNSSQESPVKEDGDLKELERKVKAEAAKANISSKVETTVGEDGLTVRLKTDGLFFDPGSATIKPRAVPIVKSLADMLRADGRHGVMVSGHTDSQPVSGQYPTNWELSTARAAAVVRLLVTDKVSPARLTATGRAYFDPVSTNATAAGRADNRRVELFLPRSAAPAATDSLATSDSTS